MDSVDLFRRPLFQRLSNEHCEKLYFASLEILERTGVYFEEQEAITLLKKAGCTLIDSNRVRIPFHLIDWALHKAPKQIILYNREGYPAIRLGGFRHYFGVGSDGNNLLDHRTGERRRGTKKDIEEGIRLCDSLENIDFIMSLLIPKDVSERIFDLVQMEIMLSNSIKPIIVVNSNVQGFKDCVRMAEIVAGGKEEFQRKPFIGTYVNMTRPLLHNKECTQRLLFAAEKGIPCVFTASKALKGVITPIATPAYIASTFAGQLAGLVISQLKKEGSPFIFEGAGGGTFDMKTMLGAIAAPDNRGFIPDFTRYLGMPMFGQGGGSDSKIVDGQAVAEASFSILLQALSNAGIIHDVGYIESHSTQSFVMLVICNELISWVKHFLKGIEINEETLALDAIDEVEPEGHYIKHEHNLKYFRNEWYPEIFDRNRYDNWISSGGKSLEQRANEKVEKILESYTPKQLPEDMKIKLKDVINEAKNK